jgi:hypothetical protein
MLQQTDAPRARCESANASACATASGIFTLHLPATPSLTAAAAQALACAGELPVGRVVSGGGLRDQATSMQLARQLPEALAPHLREDFEWYACRGAFIHNDAHYGDVLLGAWWIQGPAREIAFARLRLRTAGAPADLVVFDPFAPHAVLDQDHLHHTREAYLADPPGVFLGFELAPARSVRTVFGIDEPPVGRGVVLSSQVPMHAETGAFG